MNADEFLTLIVRIFRKKRIPFIIHGATAMGLHGYRRMTEDLDVIVSASEKKVIGIFEKEGFTKVRSQMTEDGMVHRLSYDVWYLDIFIESNKRSWLGLRSRADKVKWGRYKVLVISKKDLIKRKLKRGSHKDHMDVHVLKHMK
jgi:hypothetical protein